MAPTTQNRERVTVSSLPQIEWDKMSGGDRNHSVTKVRTTAGGKKKPLTGDSTVDNVTTEAFIDPVAHAGVLLALHTGQTYAGTTLSRQFIDAAEVPIGNALAFYDCAVTKFTLTDADANGEEGAKLTVEWVVGD